MTVNETFGKVNNCEDGSAIDRVAASFGKVFEQMRALPFKVRSEIVEHIIRPRWISIDNDEDGGRELGVEILGIPCGYYKWDDPTFYGEDCAFRNINKREFGEVVNAER